MPLQTGCPSCNRQLRVPDNLIGQLVKCPTCMKTFTAEEQRAVSAVASSPSIPPQRQPPELEPKPEPEPPPRRRNFDDIDDLPLRSHPRFHEGGYRADALPHRGGLILTLGILSIALLPLCWPLTSISALGLGIPAWVMGQGDRKKMREGLMDSEGEGITNAGWICGIIGTGLGALSILGGIAFILLIIVTNQ